jgi:hypothetical protein
MKWYTVFLKDNIFIRLYLYIKRGIISIYKIVESIKVNKYSDNWVDFLNSKKELITRIKSVLLWRLYYRNIHGTNKNAIKKKLYDYKNTFIFNMTNHCHFILILKTDYL